MIKDLFRIIIFAIFTIMTFKPAFSSVEEPKYQIITKEDNIEIRQYEQMISAEVKIFGNRKSAINSGFRILADYIFGNNQKDLKIAMTAPVRQYKITTGFKADQATEWIISFIMPSKFSYADLPLANNSEILIKLLEPKKYLTIRFSGLASDKKLKNALEQLEIYAKNNQLNIRENILFAFYNPPWTLPFMRRNEIMLEVIN